MKKLIELELQRFSIKPHLIGLLIANIVILLLSIVVSTFLSLLVDFMSTASLPDITLTTVSLAIMLVRAALLVWQGALIAKLIIEEYQNKTISLLYTYPINCKKLIYAKLILISGIMLLFHIISSAFQHSMVFLISSLLGFVTFGLENIALQLIITSSTILLGFLPLTVGMIHRSSIAAVVTSVVIVAFSSNSQGSTAGLLSIPVIALLLGILGLFLTIVTIRKMITSDLSV